MPIPLWDFQQKLHDDARQAMRHHKNVLIQSATGSGKTRTACSIIESALNKNKRVIFNCHRTDILVQAANSIRGFGIDCGIIQSGHPCTDQPAQVASIDTLKNRLTDITPPDLFIWDEAHHIRAGGWTDIHQAFEDTYHLGLSATPVRADNRGLGEIFETVVSGPSVKWLIDNGYLAKYRLFSFPPQNDDQDYINVSADIINQYKKTSLGELAIGFAPTLEISSELAKRFNQAGIPAVHLDGYMPYEIRREELTKFARGETLVCWNKNLFSEGFDISAYTGIPVTINTLIDCAKTKSLSTWLQRCGRPLRKQDKFAIINDHAGNYYTHGAPCDPRIWTLDGVEYEPEPFFQCPKCFHAQEPTKTCVRCGETYQSLSVNKKQKNLLVSDVELTEIPNDHLSLDDKQAVNNYHPRWKTHVQRAREEKKRLRERLIELSDYDRDYIWSMKPKQLKKEIYEHECRLSDETNMEDGE